MSFISISNQYRYVLDEVGPYLLGSWFHGCSDPSFGVVRFVKVVSE